MKKYKGSLLAIISIIVGIIAIPLFMIVDRWYSTPYPMISYQKNCPREIWFSGTTDYSPTFNNIGDSSGIFYQCISSDEFLINGGSNECIPEVELMKSTDFKSYFGGKRLSISPREELLEEIQEASINVEIFCNQNIWFLSKECGSRNYQCNYVKGKQWFELINP